MYDHYREFDNNKRNKQLDRKQKRKQKQQAQLLIEPAFLAEYKKDDTHELKKKY